MKERPSDEDLLWLAGLLEGEGSFCADNSERLYKRPTVHVVTRDKDVAERAGRLLGVKPVISRARKAHWSDMWRVKKEGKGAVWLMNCIYPVMGVRRQAQIQRALASWRPYKHKASEQDMLVIRGLEASGVSRSDIHKRFPHLTRSYINQLANGTTTIKERKTFDGWGTLPIFTHLTDRNQLLWLAGYAEGEGCFTATRPKSRSDIPRKLRVMLMLVTTDSDIAARAQNLMNASAGCYSPPKQKPHWSECHRVWLRNKEAVQWMRLLQPLMGRRRASRIQDLQTQISKDPKWKAELEWLTENNLDGGGWS